MTDPTIRPRLIDGEPYCSGDCPSFYSDHRYPHRCKVSGDEIYDDSRCIPGLRRLLAEAREERDAARRELCDELAMWSNEFPVSSDPEWYANERKWSYLYAPTQCGGVKGGGE